MDTIIQTIEKQGKKFLAKTLKNFFHTSILKYSQEIQNHTPNKEIESELLESFREEMKERNFSEKNIEEAILFLQNKRILQTAPHTSLVPSPRMFCIDWLSTRVLKKNELYIVCSFSGIPFSNNAKPGRLYSDNENLNFVPSKNQDALVYSAPIFKKDIDNSHNIFKNISIPNPNTYTRFSDWACDTSQYLHQKTIHPNTIYLDINKIINRYLLKILHNKNHFIHRLLFEEQTRNAFKKTFGEDIHLFYSEYDSKKYKKQESLFFDGYTLKGNHTEIKLQIEELETKLKNLTLCSAPIIVFTILTFINDCKCLGSFMQIEYLSHFKEKWKASGLLISIENSKTENLSTGQFPNFKGNAIDFLEQNPKLVETSESMETLWNPITHLFVK